MPRTMPILSKADARRAARITHWIAVAKKTGVIANFSNRCPECDAPSPLPCHESCTAQ